MNTINFNENAENRKKEIINEINFLISKGIDKKDAINNILKESCIGNSYKEKIINYFN